jgi:antirestriction protein
MKPSIYVGTYAKYNSGSIEGQWFDLEDYADSEEFYAACQDFHGPGEHEFMFQDWQDIPDAMISESYLNPEVWAWLELDEGEREMVAAFERLFCSTEPLSTVQDACVGKADSELEYTEEYVDDSGMLEGVPDTLRNYFDYEKYARDLFIDDLIRDDESGYIFNRSW